MDKRCSASALCTPLAKYSEIASWPSFSTLTPNCFFFSNMGSIAARLSTQIRISKGSSETEVKELAVIPRTELGARSTVTTVTPVAKRPRALRNCWVLNCGVFISGVFEDTIVARGKAKRRYEQGSPACMIERHRDL